MLEENAVKENSSEDFDNLIESLKFVCGLDYHNYLALRCILVNMEQKVEFDVLKAQGKIVTPEKEVAG